MTIKYFKNRNGVEVFKIEGRDLVRGELSIEYPENSYQEITEIEYNNLITRRTGRSTRLIDYYIQELFTYGRVKIVDHHDTQKAHFDLLNRVLKRLEFDHPDVLRHVEVKGDLIKFK